MDRITDFRHVFAQMVVARADCQDSAILQAFSCVPRHQFIGTGPWSFSEGGIAWKSDDPAILYQDVAVALAPERGITTGLPSLHARCLDACALKTGERVIHIGAGSGYFTAILAELVGESGQVVGFELDKNLAELAGQNLQAWPWASVKSISGIAHGESKADLVYVSAGVEQLPHSWLESLPLGGRLLFPLVPNGEEGAMLLVGNIGSSTVFSPKFICPARFIPCIGTQDKQIRELLTEAFRGKNLESVRSLRLHPQEPDASVWLSGNGWWLSAKEK